MAIVVNNLPANVGDIEMQIQSLVQKYTLEEGMAICSNILAWRIPWKEQPHEQATVHRVTKSLTLLK